MRVILESIKYELWHQWRLLLVNGHLLCLQQILLHQQTHFGLSPIFGALDHSLWPPAHPWFGVEDHSQEVILITHSTDTNSVMNCDSIITDETFTIFGWKCDRNNFRRVEKCTGIAFQIKGFGNCRTENYTSKSSNLTDKNTTIMNFKLHTA